MGAFSQEHADAYADVAANGQAVTFTLASAGVQSDTLGTYSGATTSTVAGVAMRVSGDAKQYLALGLVEGESPTLLFVPTTYGDRPPSGSTVEFGGGDFVLRAEKPLAPDGVAITSRVVVSRP